MLFSIRDYTHAHLGTTDITGVTPDINDRSPGRPGCETVRFV